MSAARRIGILAGGGSLPREIADSIAARGIPLHIVAIDGEADADFGPYPVTRVNWGEIGRMVATFKQTDCADLVIIGSVKRPDLATIKPDMGFVAALGTILRLVLAGGDDRVLRGVIHFFEKRGFRIVSPARLAPELVIGAGQITSAPLPDTVAADARLGFEIIAALGRFDIGQAAIVTNGTLEALEAAEGTDRMLARLAAERRAGGGPLAAAEGVLVKRTKPSQDDRIDLPVIGPETITRASGSGLAALVVEAGRALAANREELTARAAASGLAVAGLEIARDRASAGSNLTASGTRSWTERALTALRGRRAARNLETHQLGQRAIPASSLRDIRKGLAVIEALTPWCDTRAVVVVRGHVLAVETGEGVTAALERAAGLRQWGDKRLRRRSGAVVIDAGRFCETAQVAIAASAGFAGLIVKLRRFTAGVPAETIRAADKAGIFVAGIPTDGDERHG